MTDFYKLFKNFQPKIYFFQHLSIIKLEWLDLKSTYDKLHLYFDILFSISTVLY